MGVLGSLVGGLFGLGSSVHQANKNLQAQREANETNLQIAQMNNEFNQAQFERQLEYNYDMFDKESALQKELAQQQFDYNSQLQDKANHFTAEQADKANAFTAAQQEKAQQFTAEQAEKANLFTAEQAEKANAFTAQQNQLDRDYNASEAEKARAFNAAMADKANQFSLSMWEKQNQYNSAAQQRARIEAAGLNPYMMLSGGSAGTAGSVSGSMASGGAASHSGGSGVAGHGAAGSSSGASGVAGSGAGASVGLGSAPHANGVTPIAAESVRVMPEMLDMSGARAVVQQFIENMMNSKQQNSQQRLYDAEARGKEIENKFAAVRLMADIENRKQDTANKKLEAIYQGVLNDFAAENQINDLKIKRQQVNSMKMDYQLKATQVALNNVHLKYLPQSMQAEIASKYADISLRYAQGRLSDAQASSTLKQSILFEAQAAGVKLNNKVLNSSVDSLISQARAQAERAWNNSGGDNLFQFLNNAVDAWKRNRGW